MIRDTTSKQKRKKAWLIGIVAGLAFCCAGAMLASHTASMLLESNKKDGLVALPMERQERNRDRHRALTALVDNNPPTELVAKGISHQDIDLEDGRYCILDANEVKSIIGEREWMKATNQEPGVSILTETSKIAEEGKEPVGAVLRARNERTNTEGGLLMFSNGGTDVFACWNPTKDTESDDWKVDDVLSLLDYPANDVRSEQLANVTAYSIIGGWWGGNLGWYLEAENIRFGESGVVGHVWAGMEIEYELSGDNVAIEGIWTDSVELPYTIKYYDEDTDSWVVAKENCRGNVYDLELAKVSAKKWRLNWVSTDWQKTKGLSTEGSGGGLHAELVKYTTNPTEGPVTVGGGKYRYEE